MISEMGPAAVREPQLALVPFKHSAVELVDGQLVETRGGRAAGLPPLQPAAPGLEECDDQQ
jgi:hypothetical protein